MTELRGIQYFCRSWTPGRPLPSHGETTKAILTRESGSRNADRVIIEKSQVCAVVSGNRREGVKGE